MIKFLKEIWLSNDIRIRWIIFPSTTPHQESNEYINEDGDNEWWRH